jgi:hypothetical protein
MPTGQKLPRPPGSRNVEPCRRSKPTPWRLPAQRPHCRVRRRRMPESHRSGAIGSRQGARFDRRCAAGRVARCRILRPSVAQGSPSRENAWVVFSLLQQRSSSPFANDHVTSALQANRARLALGNDVRRLAAGALLDLPQVARERNEIRKRGLRLLIELA